MANLQQRIRSFLPGVYPNASAGPEGFLAARVHRLLSHDTTLREIFEDQIDLLTVFNPVEFGRAPRCQIAPTFTREPDLAPGQREERPVEITVRLLDDATTWKEIYKGPSPSSTTTDEEPGISDLAQYIIQLLKSSRELAEGNEKMVQPGETVYEALSNEWVIVENGPTYFIQDIRVTFTVRIDSTGQIDNLNNARS